ncbi:helix-turn-helix domain-containing protein [Fimbriimonas ginsengisoli]|uniref:Helix-turn-helix-domain containing protein, AraC type n=1 Tax=Fimbriimonas ginsengisoli Gsoil 348 TaxID=661478 RepID=A0A068NMY5_FIMGI|nr:AraC family transcriptional regulator [Fimbriimonas ginsengisoli]AIE84080.1 helix-turn-helix- domain containing protein, AraC type [Fimbriimonas ginsengisoli Gsoil 348]
MLSSGGLDLAFLAASRVPECWQVVDKHLVGYSTIQYMERGAVEIAYDDRRYRCEGPTFWPAHPGPRVYFTSANSRQTWFHRHVAFQGPLVGRWVAEGLWPTAPQAVDDEEFPTKMDRLIEFAKRDDIWSWRRGINLLEGMLLQLAEARAGSARREEWLTDVLRRLDSVPPFEHDFSALATDLAMAPSTLRRRFRAAMGHSLRDHLITTRTVRAKEMLIDTDLTLEAISERLGYGSAAFFSRQFKQSVGVSPSLFRRSRV